MSRRVLGIRRGNSVQERIQNPVQDLAGLRLIPTTDVVDKAILNVEDNGLYYYDYEGLGIDDGSTVIEPTVGPGRWFLLTSSATVSLQDTERLRHYFPVIAGTELKNKDWAWANLTITRIDVLVLSAITTAGAYTLAITGAGNNLLSTPTVDLLGLTPGTITELTLTGTALDLQLSDKEIVEMVVDSDNADLTGGGAVMIIIYAEETGGGGGGGGGGENLEDTLAIGNFTGPYDILVESGRAVIGEPAPGGSGFDGSPLELRGGLGDGAGSQAPVFFQPVGHAEKAFKLTEANASEFFGGGDHVPAAGEGIIYVDDGDVANELQADTPYFVSGGFGSSFINMIGGWVENAPLTTPGPHFVALTRGVVGYVPPLTGSAAVFLSLPDSNTNRGRVVWVEHQGDGTGSITVSATGGNTIDGLGGTVSVTHGLFKAFLADGDGDWRSIDFPGAGGGIAGPGAVTAVNQVALWTDGTGTAVKESTMTVVGNDADVVGTLTAAEVVAGDLVLKSKKRNARWRMIEHHDFIEVVNEKTDQRFKLALIPLETP